MAAGRSWQCQNATLKDDEPFRGCWGVPLPARFREWFNEYESNVKAGALKNSKPPIEETLKRLRGSLKGTGALEALMEERQKESLL